MCLNTGCVRSKALLRHAEIASIITHECATFGISGDVSVDMIADDARRELLGAHVVGSEANRRLPGRPSILGGPAASLSRTLLMAPDGGARAGENFTTSSRSPG